MLNCTIYALVSTITLDFTLRNLQIMTL